MQQIRRVCFEGGDELYNSLTVRRGLRLQDIQPNPVTGIHGLSHCCFCLRCPFGWMQGIHQVSALSLNKSGVAGSHQLLGRFSRLFTGV